jgi:hypothetical protein
MKAGEGVKPAAVGGPVDLQSERENNYRLYIEDRELSTR